MLSCHHGGGGGGCLKIFKPCVCKKRFKHLSLYFQHLFSLFFLTLFFIFLLVFLHFSFCHPFSHWVFSIFSFSFQIAELVMAEFSHYCWCHDTNSDIDLHPLAGADEVSGDTMVSGQYHTWLKNMQLVFVMRDLGVACLTL
jgi:hypothetical protein